MLVKYYYTFIQQLIIFCDKAKGKTYVIISTQIILH